MDDIEKSFWATTETVKLTKPFRTRSGDFHQLLFTDKVTEDGYLECVETWITLDEVLRQRRAGMVYYEEPPVCEYCCKTHVTLYWCEGCMEVMYCSKKCQKKDWNKFCHKERCKWTPGVGKS